MKANNNNNIQSGIIIIFLLSIICGLNTACKKTACNYLPCAIADSINISTGQGKNGNIDLNWIASSSPFFPITNAIIIKPGHVSWQQTTTITGTNAGWINCTGIPTTFANTPGDYTYQTTFAIPANTISFTCDFSLAYDDKLISIELVDPSSIIPITLTEPSHTMPLANLGPNLGTLIANPSVGNWKIRVKIRNNDTGTGLLLSGYIRFLKPCK